MSNSTSGNVAFHNVVDGSVSDAASGETYDIVDPSTGEVYATAPASAAEDVDRAFRAAAAAAEGWGNTTPAERQRALLKIADALEHRSEEFVRVESRDTGKPLALTTSDELPPAIDQIRFFAGAARVLEGKSGGEYLADHTSFVRREPIGVVAQVTPWNYPLMMMVWKIAPALAAGNAIVLKPSDTTPASSTLLAQLCQDFLPPGVLNVVTGDRDTGPPPRRASDPAIGGHHGFHPGRHGGGRGGRPAAQAGAPGAGRQGAGGGLRRRGTNRSRIPLQRVPSRRGRYRRRRPCPSISF